MEFEDVSEHIQWEARRLAAAFGIKTFEAIKGEVWENNFRGHLGCISVFWTVDSATSTFSFIAIAYGIGFEAEEVRLLGESSNHWHIEWENTSTPNPLFRDLLARRLVKGLYQLSFDDDVIYSQLPKLSAHEKFELRLSMPREFWPQRWLDERDQE